MTLKELRVSRKLTQEEAASKLGISRRSYVTYENDPEKENTIKYKYLMCEIEKLNKIDEENGIISIDDITFGSSVHGINGADNILSLNSCSSSGISNKPTTLM